MRAVRNPWRRSANLTVADHNVPTTSRRAGMADPRQGIAHVVGPERGATLPGVTVVCGDSHTSTHGACGAPAFDIGTSEVEHVLAIQCLQQKKSKNMLIRIRVEGVAGRRVIAKDIVLAIVGKIGTAGGTGYALGFAAFEGAHFAPVFPAGAGKSVKACST